MKCVKCGSKEVSKTGKYKTVQRYRCKECGRYFRENPPKYTEQDRKRALEYYLNNCGVRKTARFIGCSPGTIIVWIRQFAAQIREEQSNKDREPIGESEIIEMDEIYTIVKKTNGSDMDGLCKKTM